MVHVLSSDVFALFHWHFYCDSITREKKCIPNLPCTQTPFGNYWASAMFSGPDFIANLSDGLKIMDLIFITSDDIGNAFCHKFETYEAAFWQL